MEEIKPKKEKKFFKVMGEVALILFRELILNVGKKVINKVGNKRQGLVIAFLLVAGISYASIDSIPYPVTGNKQRLGWQTSGNGLVYRGRSNDTITKPSSYVDKNVKAYLLLDSVRGTIFVWRQTYWDSILVGSGAFTQPIDSLFFDTSVPTNNVETAKMQWDSDLGTVVLGLNDNVPNELGFKNFWLVKNQTGSTITKGSIVYANGTVGASGRITVAKFIANGSIDAKYLLGITAHDLTDGEDGYVISFGKIRQVNTDTFAAGAILYPSPTVAGVWTDIEPVAPNLDMPIGFCINSSSNNGTIAIRVASGLYLREIHDVSITSPVDNGSLYYKSSEGLWRDTLAALLVSDTASMLSNYATKAYADTTGRLYARQDFTNVSSSTLTWTQSDTLIPGGVNVVQVYRNGQILLPSQYTIPTSTSVIIAASSFKVNDNYTVIFPRGGGAGSGGGSGSLTSISAGTGITVSPNPITTTGTVSADLSVLMELTDTSLLNLTTRFASKLNTTDTASLSNRIDAKGNGTVTSVGNGYGLLSTQSPITTSGVIRVDSNTIYNYVRDSIVKVRIGNDTIKILKQEYNNVTTDTLTWTTTNKFPIQLRAFILLFRNGQLLINDQYSVIDTNKIKIAATSYKVGENYTLVTVSGIGSAGVSQTGNPVYPEAGIALSTGTTWTTSIPNNSSNWNTAFTDRLKWDGGSTGLVPSTGRTSLGGTTIGQNMFTLTNPSTISFPRFNADNTVTSRSAANFRTDIGAGTVTSVNVAAGTPLSIQNNTTIPEISMSAATGSVNGYLTSTDWTTFNNKQNALSNASASVSGILTSTDWTTFNNKENTITAGTTGQYFRGDKTFQTLNKSAVGLSNVDNTSDANKPVSTATQTALNLKVNISDTASMLTPYFRDADTTQLNLTSRFNTKQNQLSGTGFVKANGTSITYDNSTYLTTGTAASTYLPLTGGTLTGGLTGTTGTFTGLNVNGLFKFGGATNYLSQNFDNGGYYSEITGSSSLNRQIRFQGLNDAGTKYTSINLYTGLSTIILRTDEFNKMELTNNILVINEDSQDTDFRVESDGNANMVFVDASANHVGIGTNAPDKTLHVNGEVKIATVTATPSSLLGKDGSNVVGTVTLGNTLNLTSGTLNVNNKITDINTSTYTILSTDYYIDNKNSSSTTIILPLAGLNTFRELKFKNSSTGSLIANGNIIPLSGSGTTTTILSATNAKWCTLVSDGTDWRIMQAN